METLKKSRINPKVIVNGSAIGFYGTSLTQEFNENSQSGNDFLANLCNKWEEVANGKPFFSRLVIFRIGIVLEAEGGALGKMLPVFKIGLGGPIGDGNQWMIFAVTLLFPKEKLKKLISFISQYLCPIQYPL